MSALFSLSLDAYLVLAGVFLVLLFIISRWMTLPGSLLSRRSRQMIEEARAKADGIHQTADLEVREKLHGLRQRFEDETRDSRKEMEALRSDLYRREAELERRVDKFQVGQDKFGEERERLRELEERFRRESASLQTALHEQNERLEQISGFSPEEAKQILMENMEDEARREAFLKVKRIKEESERSARKESRRIVTIALQRFASSHTAETTVSVVELPNDEMKGRIIGREGRNIRSFEGLTGVTLIIDDTPGAVVLSAFNPVRREVARRSLEKLVQDGRIHPTRIEELVAETSEEVEASIHEAGEDTLFDMDIHGVSPEILRLLGSQQYRSSYGQSLLAHSREVAWLSGVMASELGLDAALARRAGLFHDIGKCIEKETEGTHAALGAQIAERHGENAVVINAIGGHHEEIEPTSMITLLVSAADAISSSRPGARRETAENYIKRLQKLEDIAKGFPGVSKSYAVLAGREVRILVDSVTVDDRQAEQLGLDVARKIEKDLEYPGQVRVVIIRETRSESTAR